MEQCLNFVVKMSVYSRLLYFRHAAAKPELCVTSVFVLVPVELLKQRVIVHNHTTAFHTSGLGINSV